jgi:predicted DNA-binding protein (MmcQ/YjbR family)
MDFESIRKFCLSLPGATEDIQWEKDLLFRIGGKMFAVVGLEPEPNNVAFKCTPDEFAELTLRNGIIPAPYLARHHWVSITDLGVIRRAELERLLRISYQLVFAGLPKKLQTSIPSKQVQKKATRNKKARLH